MGRSRWLGLALILAVVTALFGGSGASAADEWQHLAIPGETLILRADSRVSSTLVAAPAQAPALRAQAAQITVEYDGFSAEAQAAFQAAVNIWQGFLNAPIPIRVQATWTELDEGVLGGARPAGFLINTSTNIIYPVALGQQLANTDPNPGEFDIEAVFNNTGVNWYFGSGQAPAGTYNLTSVVLHELAHGLGFTDSFFIEDGVGAYGDDEGNPLIFDRFVVNSDGVPLTDTSRYPNPSTALADQIESEALFFNGTRARAANNGAPPRLYAPDPFELGSSVAHFDEETYPAGNPNSLMTPFLRSGESIYDPGALTLGVFADLGWSVTGGTTPPPSPTPSPSTPPSPAPSATPTPAPSTPTPTPTPAPSAPPSPPSTGNGGYLPGLPNTGDGSMGGGGEAGRTGWLLLLPFIALGAGLPIALRVRRRLG